MFPKIYIYTYGYSYLIKNFNGECASHTAKNNNKKNKWFKSCKNFSRYYQLLG